MERFPPRTVLASGPLDPGERDLPSPSPVLRCLAGLRALGAEASLVELDPGGAPIPAGMVASVLRALLALRTARAEVVHVHGLVPAIPVLAAARALSVPVVVEVGSAHLPSHAGRPDHRPWLSRVSAAAEFPVLRAADHVVVRSRAMRDRLVEGGIAGERVTVVFPGLPASELAGAPTIPARRRDRAPSAPVAMYLGFDRTPRGLDLLASAQRRLGRSISFVLVLPRSAGPGGEILSRHGFDLGCTTVAHPDGPGGVSALLATASVLVHPQPDAPEGLNVPRALGLSLASGLPIAATDVGDLGPLLAPSRGCRLSRPDPARLATAVALAATDPEVAAAARSANPAIARRHFDAEANAARLLSLYEGVRREARRDARILRRSSL